MIYSADFETTTNMEDCRVWAWGLCSVEKPEETFTYGNALDNFFDFLFSQKENNIYYFLCNQEPNYVVLLVGRRPYGPSAPRGLQKFDQSYPKKSKKVAAEFNISKKLSSALSFFMWVVVIIF